MRFQHGTCSGFGGSSLLETGNGDNPCVQFHSSLVAFLYGKGQRVVTGRQAGRAVRQPSQGSMDEGYIVVPRTRVCNNTVFILASCMRSSMCRSSSCCAARPASVVAFVFGQSRLLKVVSHTALVSCLGDEGMPGSEKSCAFARLQMPMRNRKMYLFMPEYSMVNTCKVKIFAAEEKSFSHICLYLHCNLLLLRDF